MRISILFSVVLLFAGMLQVSCKQDTNASCLLLTKEQDWGADGVVDARTVWTYDSDGNKLTEEHDSNADGTVERCNHRGEWHRNSPP